MGHDRGRKATQVGKDRHNARSDRDGKIRVNSSSWDDATVILADDVLEVRAMGKRMMVVKPCVARHYHLDPFKSERDIDDGPKLRNRAIARQRDEDRAQPVGRLYVSLSHFLGTADEFRTACIDPTESHNRIVMEAIAHLLPQSEVAA
jgi:hypothetical protein